MMLPRIPRAVPRGKRKPGLRLRPKHLEFIRQLPCVVCGKRNDFGSPVQAAHIRCGTDGGTAIKPSDRYTVPLCEQCHAKQHRVGELTFWSTLRIDPLNIALRLWTISGDAPGGERIIFRARQAIQLAKGV